MQDLCGGRIFQLIQNGIGRCVKQSVSSPRTLAGTSTRCSEGAGSHVVGGMLMACIGSTNVLGRCFVGIAFARNMSY